MNQIPEDHLKTVCKMGQGEATCRYIAGTGGGIHCVKGDKAWKHIIDTRVAGMNAKGNNCEGAPA